MEDQSAYVQLDCIVYENGHGSPSQIFLHTSGFNQLLNELHVRGIELDFDRFETLAVSEDEVIHCLDLDGEKPVYLPSYCMPHDRVLLRA